MFAGYGPEPPDAERENAFWEKVRSSKDADPTPIDHALTDRGWFPPDPDSISDEAMPAALERLVLDLSWLHVYLSCCEHQPDRVLYEQLYEWIVWSDQDVYPDDPESAISVHVGSASPKQVDFDIYARYYADDQWRASHAEHNPDQLLPAAELPPYPRPWLPLRPMFD